VTRSFTGQTVYKHWKTTSRHKTSDRS